MSFTTSGRHWWGKGLHKDAPLRRERTLIRPSQDARLKTMADFDSRSELEYHLIVARDIHAISLSDFTSLTDQVTEVRKMLYGLTKRVTAPRLDQPLLSDVPT